MGDLFLPYSFEEKRKALDELDHVISGKGLRVKKIKIKRINYE